MTSWLSKSRRGNTLKETEYNCLSRTPDDSGYDPSISELENDTVQTGRARSPRKGRPRRSVAQHHLSRMKSVFLILLAAWGLAGTGYVLYNYSMSRFSTEATPVTPLPVSCNCGDTIAEAVANGCKYDSIAAAWLPLECRDDELIAEFERAGPNPDGSWPYYADINKTHTLSLEEVSMLPENGGHFFTTHHWHLVHCAYYWKKMWLAPKRGITIERRYDTLMHINHCEMMFLQRDPLDRIVTEAGVSLHSDRIVIGKEKHQHLQHDDHDSEKINESDNEHSDGDQKEENY